MASGIDPGQHEQLKRAQALIDKVQVALERSRARIARTEALNAERDQGAGKR
jgi:hypothetical protein